MRQRIREHVRFVSAFLRRPATVGAIAPSSRSLGRAMVRGIAIRPGDAVVEFGPGTGVFTAEIHRILPDKRAYLGIECELPFVRMLEKRFPDLRFAAASAADAPALCKAAGLGPVKVVISGIPFATIPARVQARIVKGVGRILAPGAVFRTFQYLPAYPMPSARRFRTRMDRLFGRHEERRVVLRNLPPAFVLTWRKN
ncbi:MAG: SAM-dependent methyltransferase [Planctomycetota bacterium]